MYGSDFGLKGLTSKERDHAIRTLSEEWWMQPTHDNGWDGCAALGGRCGLPLRRVWAGEWVGSDGTCRRQISFACPCCGTVYAMTRIWNPKARMWTPPLWREHEANPKWVSKAGRDHLLKATIQT